MATERELKSQQEATLFDILNLVSAISEEEREELLYLMLERAQSGMTADEIDAVRERVSRARSKKRK